MIDVLDVQGWLIWKMEIYMDVLLLRKELQSKETHQERRNFMSNYTKPVIIEMQTTVSQGCGQGTCNGK